MPWINKETENISKTQCFIWFKMKYNLSETQLMWSNVKVPLLYNKNIAFVVYIEQGSLILSLYDYKNGFWVYYPFNLVVGMEKFDFKNYYDFVNLNITVDEIGNIDITKKLNYYVHFIDEFLPEIFDGNFTKIKEIEKMSIEQQDQILSAISKISPIL